MESHHRSQDPNAPQLQRDSETSADSSKPATSQPTLQYPRDMEIPDSEEDVSEFCDEAMELDLESWLRAQGRKI